MLLRDIHEGHLPLKDADNDQIHFAAKIKNIYIKVKNQLKKSLGLLFKAREYVLNNFKIRLFPIKDLDNILTHESSPEPATEPTKHKKSKLKLEQEFMNHIINDEKDINDERNILELF